MAVLMPSVLWHCWLHVSKGIQPVKNCTLTWLSVWSEVQTCICPSWCHCHSLSLASVKSRLVLPFRYRLTRVVPDKGSLNGCVCVFTAADSDRRNWLEALHHGRRGTGFAWCLRTTKHIWAADRSSTTGRRLRHIGHYVLRHFVFHKVC